jgi:acetylornithine deacetylase/succinyl-diaminopimelate desuccinylase-like protein
MNNDKAVLGDLFDFLKIPSVSTLPERAGEVRRAADWLVDYFGKIGLEAGEVETKGHPLVWASWRELPGKPTLLFYGHYDVQPPDPLDEWKSSPFEPTVRGNKLFARGAADNKGQLFVNLLAVKQLLAEEGSLPVNVVFVVEGEEEIGSVHFEEAMAKMGERFKADAALVTDVGMPAPGQPVLIYGLRGLIGFKVTVTGPRRDLHSGSYGGMVENPAQVLVKLLAGLKDEEGKVTVPGFYDDVIEATSQEREILTRLPRSEEDERREAGVKLLTSEPGFTPRESTKIRPSLDINGLKAGFAGERAKTIIPAEASAVFTMRIVPAQKPEMVARRTVEFLKRQSPGTVDCRIKVLGASPAVRVDPESNFAKVVRGGLEAAFGKPALLNLAGGSIAAAGVLAGRGMPVVMTGFTLPDDQIHAPNENLDLPHFFKGIEAVKEILRRF